MSKPPKLDLRSIVAASVASHVRPEPEPLHAGIAPAAAPLKPPGTLKERARQLSVYLEPAVYDQLRDIAYAERTKLHPLMLEALDLLFKKRGASSIKQLAGRAVRSA
jgi:hypothetical protein